MATYTTWDRYLIGSDFHIPFQDQQAVELFFKFGKDYKPKTIILNGDVMDCYAISDFDKSPDRLHEASFRQELDQTRAFLNRLRKDFPKAEIIWTEGNHEYRLKRLLKSKAPELWGLISIEQLLDLKKLKIKYINCIGRNSYYNITKHLQVGHFDKVSSIPGRAAYDLMKQKFISIIQGHVHRAGMIYHSSLLGDHVGVDGGCMCTIDDPEGYTLAPNWQEAFTTVDVNRNTQHFHISIHKIVRDNEKKFVIYGGKEFIV